MSSPSDPREAGLAVLRSVEEGGLASRLIERARIYLTPLNSALFLELVYGVLRNRAYIDYSLNLFSEKPIEKTDAWTRNILRLGAYQLLFLDRVPARAAVDTSVQLAKRYGRKPGYVNGLLRSLARNSNRIEPPSRDNIIRFLSIEYSHPEWLVKRWVSRYGPGTAETLLRSNNQRPPLTIRANTLKVSREALKSALESEGCVVKDCLYAPAGIEIVSSPRLADLGSFQKGLFMVQDEAAQLVSMLLDPRPGETILDACAAPGGKAAHIAELMKHEGKVIALDNDPERLKMLKENIERLGLEIIEPVLAQADQYQGGIFDRILIDAPCSGLGVLRRHPDGRWTKTGQTVTNHRLLQEKILEACSKILKPGGTLVYATCTTEPEENEDVIASFIARKAGFMLDDARPYLPLNAAHLIDSQGFYRTWPSEPGMDGFFAARLKKNI